MSFLKSESSALVAAVAATAAVAKLFFAGLVCCASRERLLCLLAVGYTQHLDARNAKSDGSQCLPAAQSSIVPTVIASECLMLWFDCGSCQGFLSLSCSCVPFGFENT